MQAAGIRFPKLPELDKEDIKAVRRRGRRRLFASGEIRFRAAPIAARCPNRAENGRSSSTKATGRVPACSDPLRWILQSLVAGARIAETAVAATAAITLSLLATPPIEAAQQTSAGNQYQKHAGDAARRIGNGRKL
jgi:hypothetical protein